MSMNNTVEQLIGATLDRVEKVLDIYSGPESDQRNLRSAISESRKFAEEGIDSGVSDSDLGDLFAKTVDACINASEVRAKCVALSVRYVTLAAKDGLFLRQLERINAVPKCVSMQTISRLTDLSLENAREAENSAN
jgi:hypothetical protein